MLSFGTPKFYVFGQLEPFAVARNLDGTTSILSQQIDGVVLP